MVNELPASFASFASLLRAADAFRVTWSGKVFESPGHSSQLRHRNELTEKAWEDAVQGIGKERDRSMKVATMIRIFGTDFIEVIIASFVSFCTYHSTAKS